MSWIGFISDTIFGHCNNSIQDAHFVVPFNSLTNSPSDFQLKVLRKFRLQPVEITVGSKCCEIVPVDDATQLPLRVVKAARRSCARFESDEF